MQVSYTKNYLKIYFFQILSIILGFASLFIVVPNLSADKTTYGVYTICISITVFLSYADLGFLGAGLKYAAESYAQGDRDEEMKLIGFSHFILMIFIIIIAGVFLFLSFNPHLLIKGIQDSDQIKIAKSLLLILAIFSPTIILQRMLQMIFSIRLQDYILQKITILGNIIKIASVFYFFGFGNYNIVNYFLFTQVVNLIAAIIGIFLVKNLYKYDFGFLIRHLMFSMETFNKTKALAFSSLFVTICWVLYYELDSFSIGYLIGAKEVAVYAIGFTILSFFRSIFGVFFSPFSARFNHFIGTNKQDELKSFYLHVMNITFPIVVFPIVAVVIFARPLVISWVGVEYEQSIIILKWLVLCNILAFISYPSGMMIVAQEKLKVMYVLSFLMPFIFWGGIIISIQSLGVVSFAIFKLVAFTLGGLLYLKFSLRFLDIPLFLFLKRNIAPYLPALIILIIGLLLLNDLFTDGKSKINLFMNALIIGISIFASIGLSLFTAKPLRVYLISTMNSIIKK